MQTKIDYKGLSDAAIDRIYGTVSDPDNAELIQAEIDKVVKRRYPQRRAMDRRVRFAMDNNCDI